MDQKLGKIDHSLVHDFIRHHCGARRPEVISGPDFGVDVSVIDLNDGRAMALTSDPLSLIPSLGLQESAWLSVQLMANDMATTGFAPMYGQFVLNLPAHFSQEDFKVYWKHIDRFCSDIGMAVTGGHTGFIEGQNSTIAGGGTFIAIAPKNEILTSAGASPGDAILVTKECALSSTAILALSFPETVKNKLGSEFYRLAAESFYRTSSLKDALTAAGQQQTRNAITAMHDVTEGGVLGAIYELTVASGNGAEVYNDLLPFGEVQEAVCSLFSLDSRYCVGAGSMIITCKKEGVNAVIESLAKEKIPCVEVGRLTEKEKGVKLIEEGREKALNYFHTDPYWAAFFKALKAGWK